MGSDKRGGPGAASGPRPVVVRPGSVNRGFASVDPERQREAASDGRKAADQGRKLPPAVARRTAGSGTAAQTKAGRRGRREPPSGEEGEPA